MAWEATAVVGVVTAKESVNVVVVAGVNGGVAEGKDSGDTVGGSG